MSNLPRVESPAFNPKGSNDLGVTKSHGAAPSEAKRKFNMNTPSFQPSVLTHTSKFSALLPKLKDIPTFVPAALEPPSSSSADGGASLTGRKFNASTPSFTPANAYDSFSGVTNMPEYTMDGFHAHESAASTGNEQILLSQMARASTPGPAPMAHSASPFMFHGQVTTPYPLNYHLYSPAPPPRLTDSLNAHETNVNALFIANDLHEIVTKRNEAALQTLALLSLPDQVGIYHSVVPIDTTFDTLSKVWGKPTAVYKVNSNVDGLIYALRRIDLTSADQVSSELAFHTVKKWRRLTNPNVVQLKDVFTSVAFGSPTPSLCLVYDYYPLCNTLQEQHVTRKLGVRLEPVSEPLLWTYLVQLVGALLSIHKDDLYAGSSLALSKIIVTSKNRVRLAAVCVDDIINFEDINERMKTKGKTKFLQELQRADISALGRLMAELTASTLPTALRGEFSEELVTRLKTSSTKTFSEEWLSVIRALCDPDPDFNLSDFYTQHLSLRALDVLNGLQDLSDYYEGQLLSEVENGRLFRLLAKLFSLIDRPESDADIGGNAYVLRLFRDFVFHTCDESGKPAVDLSRLLVNLNKLDAGVDENILLVSSDEDTCLIVSYKEVREILELSFRAVFRSG